MLRYMSKVTVSSAAVSTMSGVVVMVISVPPGRWRPDGPDHEALGTPRVWTAQGSRDECRAGHRRRAHTSRRILRRVRADPDAARGHTRGSHLANRAAGNRRLRDGGRTGLRPDA